MTESAQERRIPTALFADIAGFTELVMTLPPDELARLIDPVLAAMTDVVVRYGGELEKYAGDALLALFGATSAHEDDAERALRCAVELHEAVASMTHHPLGRALRLHVGVDSGPMLARTVGAEEVGQVGVVGEAVVLAQRLMSSTPPGETYVGAATADLVGSAARFDALPPLRVKGRAEPLEALRLVSVEDASGRGPARGSLAGRAAEAEELTARLRDLASGHGGAVVIAGEAGSGKTRLVELLVERAGEMGVPVVVGSAASYALTTPYQPLLPWFRSWPGETVPAVLDRLVRDRGATPADPAAEGGAGPSPEALRAEVRSSTAALLRARATARGLVAVVEDLHWSDDATRDLLGLLAAYAPDDRVLLVVSGRDREQARAALATSGAEPPRVLDLGPLDAGAVAELAAELLGGPLDARLSDALAGRSQGNPLFAAELVQALADSGDLRREDGLWRLRPGLRVDDLPMTVHAVIAGLVDALPRHLREVLVTVAVIGDVVGVREAAEVLQLPADLARANLDRLVDAGMLLPAANAYSFRHGLVRDVARDRLSGSRRREVHVRCAEAAALLGGPADQVTAAVAHHLYLADAPRLALPHLRSAAASARAVFANADAEVALARAADAAGREPVDPSLREVLLDLAEVRRLQGDNIRAADTYAAAAAAGAGVAAVAGRAGSLRRGGDYQGALDVLDAAVLDGDTDARLLDLERSWVLGLMGRREEAHAAALQGLACDVPTDVVTGRLELQLAWVLMVEGELDEAARRADRALELVDDDPVATVTAHRLLGDVALRSGDLDRARTVLLRGLAESRRTGNVEEEAACLLNLGLAASAAGDHVAAAGHYDEALEAFAAAANPGGRGITYGNRAWERMHLGELPSAESDCEHALRLARATGNVLAEADATNTRALLAQRRGDVGATQALAREAARLFREAGADTEAAAADELASAATTG